MNVHQLDDLLKRKIDRAHKGQTLLNAVAAVLCVIAAIIAGVSIHNQNKTAQPDDTLPPAQGNTEPAADVPMIAHSLQMRWPEQMLGELPEKINVIILRDGEELTSYTLSEENEWKLNWEDIADFSETDGEFPDTITVSLSAGDDRPDDSSAEGASSDGNDVDSETGEPGNSEASDDSDGEQNGAPDGEQDSDGEQDADSDGQQGADSDGAQGGNAANRGNSDDPQETDRNLPGTGPVWWPIVLLLLSGVTLLVIGKRKTDRSGTGRS